MDLPCWLWLLLLTVGPLPLMVLVGRVLRRNNPDDTPEDDPCP